MWGRSNPLARETGARGGVPVGAGEEAEPDAFLRGPGPREPDFPGEELPTSRNPP